MAKDKPARKNPTDGRLDRQKGGGYQYEWELALEIALSSLLPSLLQDWGCASTEVPVPLHLRTWLGEIQSISFDAASAKTARCEDINLRGSKGTTLFIQVKTTNSMTLPMIRGIVKKMLDTEKSHSGHDARYLIISQNGATHDLHRHDGTLQSFFEKRKSKGIKKEYEAFKKMLGSKHKALLARVWLIRGPVYERLLNVTHHLVARHHKLNSGNKSERLKAHERRAIIAERFKQRVCMRGEELSETSLAAIVESPPTLRGLLRRRDFEQCSLPPGHPLELIDDFLGWELETTVGPFLPELVLALSPAVRNENPLVSTIRDCLELKSFELSDSDQLAESQARFLCLVRIAVLVSGALVNDGLHPAANNKDPLATALCWLSLRAPQVSRFQDQLRISLYRPPTDHSHIRDSCSRVFEQLEPYLEGGSLREIEVSFSLPVQSPDWLPALESPPGATTPQTATPPTESNEDESSGLDVRALAHELSLLRSLPETGEPGASLAEPRLREIYEACLANGYQALLIDASEALVKALQALSRQTDALEILLSVSEAKMYGHGQGTYYRQHKDDFKALDERDGLWPRKQCLDLQLEFRSGRLRNADNILSSIDPDNSRILANQGDLTIVQARLMEARALLVHSGAKEAQQACLSLLHRVQSDWTQERLQILLAIAHVAYWSESTLLMKEACRTIEVELADNTNSEADALRVYVLGLRWLLATTNEEFNAILKSWEKLEPAISDTTVWAHFQFIRTDLELRRRLFLRDTECRRRAAHDLVRGKNVAAKILDKARSEIATESWPGALANVLTAIDMALITNDWQTLKAARQHLCQLSLADGASAAALCAYTAYSAPFGNKSVEKELLRAIDEQALTETLSTLLAYDNSPALDRVWKFLKGCVDRLNADGRRQVVAVAQNILLQDMISHEDYYARVSLLKLLSELLRCPVDREQLLTIVKILLGILESEKTQAFDDDIPSLVRRGLWSSTTLHPTGQAALLLLDKLSGLISTTKQKIGTNALLDIVLLLGVNSKESQVKLKARDILEKADARQALAEWDSLNSSPSASQISTALDHALIRCGEKVERTKTGLLEQLRVDRLGEVYSFLEHMKLDQLEVLLLAVIDCLKDPDTVSERKCDSLLLLRQPAFLRCSKKLVQSARRLLLRILNGQIEKNALDKHRDEVNSSLFSGLKIDADANFRMHDAVCQALGNFYSRARASEQLIYFTALLQQTAVGSVLHSKHAAASLQVYFQASGAAEAPELKALLVKLLSHTDDTVCKEALKALGDRVSARNELDDLYKSLLEPLIEQSYNRLQLRKGLAIFSRVATKNLEDHRHYQWVQQLNLRLQGDSNPLVSRLADLEFWDDDNSDR
jgi:hypothetical protein